MSKDHINWMLYFTTAVYLSTWICTSFSGYTEHFQCPQNSCLSPSLTFRANSYLSSLFSLFAIQRVPWLERSQAAFLLPKLKGTTFSPYSLLVFVLNKSTTLAYTSHLCLALVENCSAQPWLSPGRQSMAFSCLRQLSPGQMSKVL